MIISVDHGVRALIQGIGTGTMTIKGDAANIAIAKTDLLSLPVPGQLLEGGWEVGRITKNNRHVLTFTARRLADG